VHPTTYTLTEFFDVPSREQDNLKKKLDDVNSKVVEVRTERMQLEEKFISLRQLSEKQNTKYEELYAEKTAKVSTAVQTFILFICLISSHHSYLDFAKYFIT
jgi:predicted nuclease with TOPRIM domain